MLKNYYFAPMEGITGYTYRNAHNNCFGGIDKYYTPFVAAHVGENLKTKEKQDIAPENNADINCVPQILSNKSKAFIRVAKEIADLGYSEINFNLGCPAGTIVTKKRGAGFLSVPDDLDRFLDEIFEGIRDLNVNLSIKTRIGMKDPSEVTRIFEIYNKYPVSEIIVHPRTGKEMYRGTPHMEAFNEAISISKHKLCYNGDLKSIGDIRDFESKYPDIDSVMIGRGLLANPALIRVLKGGAVPDKNELKVFHERLYREYIDVMPGSIIAVNRMKELWNYMRVFFPNDEKKIKELRKARTDKEFEAAVRVLFSSGEFVCRE